jgi:hypothetical protein
LNELSNIIDEVEKRIECVTRCNREIDEVVFSFVDAFQDDDAETQPLTNNQFEVLLRGVHDIDIALDFKETECVDNNWYGLFEEPKKVEVVAILIPKGSIVEWEQTKQYYNVQGGAKARVTEDYTVNNAFNENYLMVEWLDDNANSQENGGYQRDCFKEEFERPMRMVDTTMGKNIVEDIIQKLKGIDVDGETMQYIIEQVGMTDQMLRQLVMSNPESDTKDLLEEKIGISNKSVRGCIEI